MILMIASSALAGGPIPLLGIGEPQGIKPTEPLKIGWSSGVDKGKLEGQKCTAFIALSSGKVTDAIAKECPEGTKSDIVDALKGSKWEFAHHSHKPMVKSAVPKSPI
jgi:hypothetical protein